ncbi:hypothetical protein [Microcoleus sp. A006_D1]
MLELAYAVIHGVEVIPNPPSKSPIGLGGFNLSSTKEFHSQRTNK